MNFKKFFGLSASDIKQNCIFCQNADFSLFAKDGNSAKGLFVKTANTRSATVIALKNNFLAGDAVLYLKETKCTKIFLFGSCGGCGNIEAGDLLIIDKSYNYESFSKMLAFDVNPGFISSSQKLTNSFLSKNSGASIRLTKTNSACVSSLLLETRYKGLFGQKGINALDMESSIVFSAAKDIEAEVACLMYVSDHIDTNPLGKNTEEKTKRKIFFARKKLAEMITDFTDEQ